MDKNLNNNGSIEDELDQSMFNLVNSHSLSYRNSRANFDKNPEMPKDYRKGVSSSIAKSNSQKRIYKSNKKSKDMKRKKIPKSLLLLLSAGILVGGIKAITLGVDYFQSQVRSNELTESQEKLSEMSKSRNTSGNIETYQQENNSLQEKLLTLEKQLATLSEGGDVDSALQQQIQALQNDYANSQKNLADQTSKNEEIEHQLDVMTAKILSMKKESEENSVLLQKQQKEIQDLRRKNKSLEEERSQYESIQLQKEYELMTTPSSSSNKQNNTKQNHEDEIIIPQKSTDSNKSQQQQNNDTKLNDLTTRLSYLKSALLQFCSQDTKTQQNMIPAILSVVGCSQDEVNKAKFGWDANHSIPFLNLFK